MSGLAATAGQLSAGRPGKVAVALRRLATTDFFPGFSARVRRAVYNPFGVLILAALASLSCGAFLHPQGYALAAGIGAVLLAGAVWPWISLRGLKATLRFDRLRMAEGESCGVSLRLGNRVPWSAWGLSLRGAFGGGPEKVDIAIARVPGARDSEFFWNLRAEQRGIFPKPGASLSTGFPFGVWHNSKKAEGENRLIVWPRVYPVGPVPSHVSERLVEGQVSRGKAGSHGDVMGVRPYRRGDSPRRIHWGQSAKHDRLVVCELQTNARPLVQIILDTHSKSHAGKGKDGTLEWAVRVAASLAEGWLAEGAELGFACAGLEVAPASGHAQKKKILDLLAGVEPGDTCLEQVLSCPVCKGFRDGLQVVVTTDRSLEEEGGCGTCERDSRRWILLSTGGFTGTPAEEMPTPSRAWLWLPNGAEVPARLRSGWVEARHGS